MKFEHLFEGEIVWKGDEYVGVTLNEDQQKMADIIVDMTCQSCGG